MVRKLARRKATTPAGNCRSEAVGAGPAGRSGIGAARWSRKLLALSVLVGGASFAQPIQAPELSAPVVAVAEDRADLSVLTYNVKGLPWPLGGDRAGALRRIGERLARLRREGRQPAVVVLQEAFTAEAKAIGEIAGYPYRIQGPDGRERQAPSGDDGRRWFRGETQGPALDSGLVVLSDLPVLEVARAPFPDDACAGYDCLAAKGVLVVTVNVRGKGAVSVATTHLNCRKASGAPFDRTIAAYRRQTVFLARFLADQRMAARPLVVAGDFNRSQRPARIALLDAALRQLGGGADPREALRDRMGEKREALSRSADAATIRWRARDMQFYFDGADAGLVPLSVEIPFGTEPDGTQFSDHMGFTVRYRLVPRGSRLSTPVGVRREVAA